MRPLSCVIALVLFGVLGPSAFGQDDGARLSFAEEDALEVSIDDGDDDGTARVVIVNRGPAISGLTFSAVSEDEDAPEVTVEPTQGAAEAPSGPSTIDLTFTSEKSLDGFSGHLIAAGGGAAAERDLSIDAKSVVPFTVNGIIFGSLVLAAAIVALRSIKLRKRLLSRLGSVDWDFSKSWASTITVVGALLGTILASSVLPDEPKRFSKETLAGMNLFFAVVILLAPLLFTATQRATEVKKDPTDANSPTVIQYQGSVIAFLGSCLLTLWGVIGELVTIGFLFAEIEAKGSLPAPVLWLLVFLLGGGALVLVIYAWTSMLTIGKHEAKKKPPADSGPGNPVPEWAPL